MYLNDAVQHNLTLNDVDARVHDHRISDRDPGKGHRQPVGEHGLEKPGVATADIAHQSPCVTGVGRVVHGLV